MNEYLQIANEISKDIMDNLLSLKLTSLNKIDLIVINIYIIFIIVIKLFTDYCFHSYTSIIVFVILDVIIIFKYFLDSR